jgi:hypothetical protein
MFTVEGIMTHFAELRAEEARRNRTVLSELQRDEAGMIRALRAAGLEKSKEQ